MIRYTSNDIVFNLKNFNPTTYRTIFTMRLDNREKIDTTPLVQFDNTDSQMTVEADKVTISLSDETTRTLSAGSVYVQLNFVSQTKHFATQSYKIFVDYNIMKKEVANANN